MGDDDPDDGIGPRTARVARIACTSPLLVRQDADGCDRVGRANCVLARSARAPARLAPEGLGRLHDRERWRVGTGGNRCRARNRRRCDDAVSVAEDLPRPRHDYTESLSLPVAGTILVAVASTPTVAYTITNPGGLITFTAAPGVGQVVTAGCEFDRGVRFDMANEALSQRIVPGYHGNVDQIEAVELLDETELPEMWYSGGALQQAVNQDVVLTLHYQFWNISNQSVGTINVWLPAPDRLPGGPMIFVVHNNGSSGGSLQLRDDIGATVGSTFAAGTTRRVALSRNSGATTWISYA